MKVNKMLAACAVVMLSLLSFAAYAQNRASGTVVDAQGNAVPGASVVVKGTMTGTMTDAQGYFAIQAPTGATLDITCIGYVSQNVAAGANLRIVLAEDNEFLDEVVVVGFGTQKKVNLTGAVAAVDVDKTFNSKPITNVSKGLQGVVPGLTISFTSNDLGETPTMKVRGTGSVNGNSNPLILLDGVEIPDLSFVNPDNIKSISVLKDAASASIYGTRAAFGVILITSKDGSGMKDRATITYSNNFSWNTPMGLPKYITDKEGILAQLQEGITAQLNTDGSDIDAFGMYFKNMPDKVAAWFDATAGKSLDETYVYGRDWEIVNGTPYYYRVSDPNKELFKTAFQQQHNLSVAGNSGNTRYNISLGYNKEETTLRYANDNYVERYNANLSTNTQVTKWLNVGTKVMYVEKTFSYPYGYEASNGGMGLLYYTMRFPTFFPFGRSDGGLTPNGSYVAPDGNTYYDARTYGAKGLLFRHGNVYVANEANCNSKDQYLTLGGNIKVDIVKGVTLYADYTRGQYNYINQTIRQPYYTANWSFPSRAAVTTNDFSRRTVVHRVTNTMNAYVDWVFDFNQEHNFALKVGSNAENLSYNYLYMSSNGVQNPDMPTLNLTNDASGKATVSEQLRDRASVGFFGRINYNYKEKYLLELNGRYDGSSTFRPGKQWAFFASGSAGWKISEEKFWENIRPYVPLLKLRASYGSVGNQALSSAYAANTQFYPYIPILSSADSGWIGTDLTNQKTVSTPALVNADMTWERVTTFDVGLDAGFLNNELNVGFDWYMRTNNGMLVPGNALVGYMGAAAPLENGGDMRTTGWELQIDYNHAFRNGLAVYGTFTMADAKAKITKWNTATNVLTGWYEGKEIGEIWGLETDRFWNKDDDPATIQALQGGIAMGSFSYGPGDIKYKDLDGNGVIDGGNGTIEDHGDLTRIGNTMPRYEYALRLGAAWKGFDAEILFQGVGKRDMWSYSSLFTTHTAGAQMNIFADQLDYWTEDNPNAKYPRPFINGSINSAIKGLPNTGNNNFYPQTNYLANLAYLRIKNVTIGYTLPQKLTQKILIDKARIYASVQNLFTFDHIGGVMDPECTGGWSSTYYDGIDRAYAGRAMPFNRQWSFGVQITLGASHSSASGASTLAAEIREAVKEAVK